MCKFWAGNESSLIQTKALTIIYFVILSMGLTANKDYPNKLVWEVLRWEITIFPCSEPLIPQMNHIWESLRQNCPGSLFWLCLHWPLLIPSSNPSHTSCTLIWMFEYHKKRRSWLPTTSDKRLWIWHQLFPHSNKFSKIHFCFIERLNHIENLLVNN